MPLSGGKVQLVSTFCKILSVHNIYIRDYFQRFIETGSARRKHKFKNGQVGALLELKSSMDNFTTYPAWLRDNKKVRMLIKLVPMNTM